MVAADMLGKILEAEKESEKALNEANVKAEKILSDARENSERAVKDAQKVSAEEFKKTTVEISEENASLIEKTRKDALEYSDGMLKNAENSKKECINIVIDKIFG